MQSFLKYLAAYMRQEVDAIKKERKNENRKGHTNSKEKHRSEILRMVRAAGLEPARFYPLEPESSASANSATRAQLTA